MKSWGVELTGLEELQKTLEKVAPNEARNLARSTVHWVAGQVRNGMRKRAPKDEGTLRKAIIAKRRRGKPGEAVSDVRITHGRGVKHDAFYWHMIEFGTERQSAQPFIEPTVAEIEPQIPKIYRDEFGKRLEKKLAKKG